jgi:hypothetical protein
VDDQKQPEQNQPIQFIESIEIVVGEPVESVEPIKRIETSSEQQPQEPEPEPEQQVEVVEVQNEPPSEP